MDNKEDDKQPQKFEPFLCKIKGVDSRHTYRLTGNVEIEFEPVKDKEGWFQVKQVTNKNK